MERKYFKQREHGYKIIPLNCVQNLESLKCVSYCGLIFCREFSSILSTKKPQEELLVPEVEMVESQSEREGAMEVGEKAEITYLVRVFLVDCSKKGDIFM